MANKYDKTAGLLRSAWEKAASHKKLFFEETNAVRFAYQTFNKIAQCGESLEDFFDTFEDDDVVLFPK